MSGIYHQLSTCSHYIQMLADTGKPLATATGFYYEYNGKTYFVTNGHNVTGYHYETKQRITKSAALVKKFRITDRGLINNGSESVIVHYDMNLYRDKEALKPCWLIHPTLGYSVDVIAIPVDKSAIDRDLIKSSINLYPKFEETKNISLRIQDDVYILGYPENLMDDYCFPIWKRGSIASEPNYGFKNNPYFLIDSSTRKGMSGSPVIMTRTGFHKELQNIGTITKFAGIYSGRYSGKNDFESHLGIVWHESVLIEIILGQMAGDIDFQLF